MALVFGGMITGYVQSAKRAEWSGYSLAAQALAIQQLEQARSAVWDISLGKNELTNLNLIAWSYDAGTKQGTGYSWAELDLPRSGTNVVRATNYVSVRMINLNNSTNPPVQVQMVRVDTVWRCNAFDAHRFFTNSAASYYAPDNRDPSSI